MNNFKIDLHIYLWSCIGITGILSQNRRTNFCDGIKKTSVINNASQVVIKWMLHLPFFWSEVKVFDPLRPHGLYSPCNTPGQNTGMGNLSLLQGIPIQGLNPGVPHCRWTLYQLIHKGRPRILERVAYPFSSGSSRPRNQCGVSYMAGGFFTELSGKP